jgi:group I intron endonuclease
MVEFKYKFPFSKPITNLGMGIYGINCEVNSKIYIGSSVDITTRWRCHLSCLRRKTHHSIVLQRAFNLYGEKLFSFVVLENLDACGQSYDGVKLELLTTEQKWIDKTKSAFLGYNIQPTAGNPSGQEIPEDVKIKMCLSTATKLDEDKVMALHGSGVLTKGVTIVDKSRVEVDPVRDHDGISVSRPSSIDERLRRLREVSADSELDASQDLPPVL